MELYSQDESAIMSSSFMCPRSVSQGSIDTIINKKANHIKDLKQQVLLHAYHVPGYFSVCLICIHSILTIILWSRHFCNHYKWGNWWLEVLRNFIMFAYSWEVMDLVACDMAGGNLKDQTILFTCFKPILLCSALLLSQLWWCLLSFKLLKRSFG